MIAEGIPTAPANNHPSQMMVATNPEANTGFTHFIHEPGRGREAINAGNTANTSQGAANPSPITSITKNNCGADAASAKLMAVPTSGAEHGVANIVAIKPLAKSPNSPCPLMRLAKAGTGKRTLSKRLRVNIAITTIITPRNHGF